MKVKTPRDKGIYGKGISAAAFLSAFIIIAGLSLSGTVAAFEASVYDLAARLISPPMTIAMKVITYAGSTAFLCGAAVLLIIIPYTRKRFGYPVAATALVSAAVNLILKNIFRRGRPEILRLVTESGYGFPSGHSQSSAAFFIAAALLLLVYVKDSKVRIPLFILCLLIPLLVGFSRIYLGVHHAGDVLAGWATGTALALTVNIAWRALDIRLRKFEKPHDFFFGDTA